MKTHARTISLVAERAVRFLRGSGAPVDSRQMVKEILATIAPDEATARRILEAAFAGDTRLRCRRGCWSLRAAESAAEAEAELEPDRVLLFVSGNRPSRREPFRLTGVSALRLQDENVVAACGGDVVEGRHGDRLRRTIREMLEGALPVTHASLAALRALEKWLGEPLEPPVSLRSLARDRVGLPASHTLEELVARLGLSWREAENPLELADTLDACLKALRRPGERLIDLRADRAKGLTPIDWSGYAFNREFLRNIPHVPGTYRFYDAEGRLLYVGKSKNLHRRIGSYFKGEGHTRSPRVKKLIASVHRIEYEATCSDLEAMLREAEQIRRDEPARNVQREVKPRGGRAARLGSILILEPAAPPHVLRAYLIRAGRLIDRVAIGPKGGGLKRVGRVLDDHFFFAPAGPTVVPGPDLNVELVVRWLGANRDRVVAFDPTDLGSSSEVLERLRWFLSQGGPLDPDGTPIHTR